MPPIQSRSFCLAGSESLYQRIYILAGQSFEVEILPNGRVRYL
ncbi:DUF6888 family protein [Nostoc sp.]